MYIYTLYIFLIMYTITDTMYSIPGIMTGEDVLPARLGLAIGYSTLMVLALVGNATIIVIYFKWKATFKIYKVN